MMLSKGGSTLLHYVVLRTDKGLKLYLGTNGTSFGFIKRQAAAYTKQEDAEMAAMTYTYAFPWIIGKLEVVFEEEGDEQDLEKFTMADLTFAFGDDRRLVLSATPINVRS